MLMISHTKPALNAIARAVNAAQSAHFSDDVLMALDKAEVLMRAEIRAEAARRDALYEGFDGAQVAHKNPST